jgi:hypothetical protein
MEPTFAVISRIANESGPPAAAASEAKSRLLGGDLLWLRPLEAGGKEEQPPPPSSLVRGSGEMGPTVEDEDILFGVGSQMMVL